MRTSFIAVIALVSSAFAAPGALDARGGVCDAGVAQCCGVNLLGAAALDCAAPAHAPVSAADFVATCSTAGKQALCCQIPIANQGVLCTPVQGS